MVPGGYFGYHYVHMHIYIYTYTYTYIHLCPGEGDGFGVTLDEILTNFRAENLQNVADPAGRLSIVSDICMHVYVY